MQRKRLFAFGDSFTQYSWPMWPDILAQNFEQAYNYGNPGIGNTCIFSYLTFVLDYEKITKDDTVIVQWSEPMRIDRIDDNDKDWVNSGSLSTEEFVINRLDRYINDYTIRFNHLIQMSVAIDLLEKIGCEWYFIFLNKQSVSHKLCSKMHFGNHLDIQLSYLLDKINKYKNKIIDTSIVDFTKENNLSALTQCWIMKGKKQTKRVFQDEHPLPKISYQFIKNELAKKMPNLNFVDMENYVSKITKIIDELGPPFNQDQVYYEIFEYQLNHNIKHATSGQSKIILNEKI